MLVVPTGAKGSVVQEFQPLRSLVVETVDRCAVFDSIDGPARDELIGALDGVRLETGEVLIAEGDPPDALYVVRHGRLRTTIATTDDEHATGAREIGQVGKGEVVGEMALITDTPRTATVTAMRDTELYRLPAAKFVDLAARYPEILRPFAGVVVQRLQQSFHGAPPSTLPATIVLLPAAGVATEDLAQAMVDEIVSYRTAVVTPREASGRADLAAWLLEVENNVDVSILLADPTPTAWTRQCLRHADRVLLVVREGQSAALTPVEADPESARRLTQVPVELVTRYRDKPSASAWSADRDLAAHHNVADDSQADVRRLVRRLTSQATVLVLGGGGARGAAHLGVIAGLLEAGVSIDAVVGTSAGALVGGYLARFGEIATAEDVLFTWFDEVRWRRDFTPPTVALLTGRLMTEAFQASYGDRLIEDLAIDFAAVSTDLCAAAPFVHTKGPLWRAVRASAAVPGIFPPVAIDDTVLVDGGLVANLPVAIARERHGDARIIAVEVGDLKGVEVGSLDDSGIASGWTALRRRGDGTPTLPKVLMRLTELGRDDDAGGADVVIRPDLAGFGLTETSAMREIMARGRTAVDAALASGDITK